MKTIGLNSNWYERQQSITVNQQKKQNLKNMKNELLQNLAEIKISRSILLKELYDYEASVYENELNLKGLSILKER